MLKVPQLLLYPPTAIIETNRLKFDPDLPSFLYHGLLQEKDVFLPGPTSLGVVVVVPDLQMKPWTNRWIIAVGETNH